GRIIREAVDDAARVLPLARRQALVVDAFEHGVVLVRTGGDHLGGDAPDDERSALQARAGADVEAEVRAGAVDAAFARIGRGERRRHVALPFVLLAELAEDRAAAARVA